MKITWVRRISQAFFLLLFLWFCITATVGTDWWKLRGWPVNWFLQLNPLVALGHILATGSLHPGMEWAMLTIVLTVILGRFFCGWVCPFGTLHQAIGWLGQRRASPAAKALRRAFRPAQRIKYYLLAFLLAAAGLGLLGMLNRAFAAGTLQTGWLDPLSFMHRAVNLVLLPLADRGVRVLWIGARVYRGAALIGGLFLAALLVNLWIPRFYCRYLCPLGALYGVLGRFALWRIGKKQDACSNCLQCETDCEGACQPAGRIRSHECVLCMNCLHTCPDDLVGYRTARSASGERAGPDLTRRGVIASLLAGFAIGPLGRLAGRRDPRLIRPPGARTERDFLSRCIRCGQCMRACPTNILHPALTEAGLEGFGTPVAHFSIGTGGCQLRCVACGQLCPTGAIRPLSLDEKLGRGVFGNKGPVKLGTAFVDRGRCLPWAMNRPCIVCQENCPVSPKAISIQEIFESLPGSFRTAARADQLTVFFEDAAPAPTVRLSDDLYCRIVGDSDSEPRRVVECGPGQWGIDPNHPWNVPPPKGVGAELLVRLQRPVVDPALCIGCGVCESVCPLPSLRAIRVSADGESREPEAGFLL
ncbi:MAG: 4Fe-4S dicluster domain-containing protein [Kiritimatiellae bacterium]|nr:4Fe-4S dicluster domain-containing protein [Kiritimatiellia bacterium]